MATAATTSLPSNSSLNGQASGRRPLKAPRSSSRPKLASPTAAPLAAVKAAPAAAPAAERKPVRRTVSRTEFFKGGRFLGWSHKLVEVDDSEPPQFSVADTYWVNECRLYGMMAAIEMGARAMEFFWVQHRPQATAFEVQAVKEWANSSAVAGLDMFLDEVWPTGPDRMRLMFAF